MPPAELVSNVERIGPPDGLAEIGARAVNDLGFDLLRLATGTSRGNVALSPCGIATGLAMARAGARGQTAAEMDRVLHVVDAATYDPAMNALDQAVRGRNRTTPTDKAHDEPLVIDLSAANRLFVQSGLNLLPGFLDTLTAHYGAAVGEVDYVTASEAARRAINGWVATETRDRIPELIEDGVLDDRTRLVLANAVYLRADWSMPFDTAPTRDGPFHAPSGDTTVPFMQSSNNCEWSEGDGWKAVELPYTGGELAMTFVVPDPGEFDSVVSRFDRAMLERVVASRPIEVHLRLPRFDLHTSLTLGEQLRALGMRLAFSDAADFSGITNDDLLEIAEVVHQANITVDEKGTVAASATAVVMRFSGAVLVEKRELDVDRPFLFLLRDRPTGALLLAGQVTNPA